MHEWSTNGSHCNNTINSDDGRCESISITILLSVADTVWTRVWAVDSCTFHAALGDTLDVLYAAY